MKFTRIILALLAPAFLANAAPSNPPARAFSHPDRIRYDSQCLTIDGRDVFIYSGAFHYFRCPKELWADRFQKIKDAGFNCVETYAAWNWSEPQMPSGTNDFSKVNVSDLDEWLTMAEKFGLYTIVRPGPYICAEWATGGYPQWLLTRKPEHPLRSQGWLRTDDPVYLAWSKHWYDAVCPVIAKHQITRKSAGSPGVILVQVENEYDFSPHFSDEIKINHLKALVHCVRADGIDVPLISCWTRQIRGSMDPDLRQVFDCCNFYPRWNVEKELGENIPKLRAEQPDAPLATTELQGGWFTAVGGQFGGKQDGFTAAQIQNLTLYAIQNGETFLNYYMLFGGSNPGDWAARGLVSSYDYSAPIREWGGVDERYQSVYAIGQMLREHGAKLARSESVDCNATTSEKDVTVVERKAADGGRYFFVRTGQHSEPRKGTATVKESGGTNEIVFSYDLEPFGSKIFHLPAGATVEQGEWLPKPAPDIQRPANIPPGVKITSAKTQSDPGPSHWITLGADETLAGAGDYGSDFVFYQTTIRCSTQTNLMVTFPNGDVVLGNINGMMAPVFSSGASSAVFPLSRGKNKVDLLYESRGIANFGKDIEQTCGIRSAQLVGATQVDGATVGGWKMKIVGNTKEHPEVATNYNDSKWPAVDASSVDSHDIPPQKTAVYRGWIVITGANLERCNWDLKFARIADHGMVYVNGQEIGKSGNRSLPFAFAISKYLHAGSNYVAITVRSDNNAGGLGAPSIEPELSGSTIPLPSFGYPAGIENKWWQPGFKDTKWKTITPGNAPAQTNLLTWYRMTFELPQPAKNIWVPWHLHLNARGNGFLYLNGHPLGRYWQAGPQHDFFLPECWLNFGSGKANTLALSLRPLEHGTAIDNAAIEPYSQFAEYR